MKSSKGTLFPSDPFARSTVQYSKIRNPEFSRSISKIVDSFYLPHTGHLKTILGLSDLGINSKNYVLQGTRGRFVLKRLVLKSPKTWSGLCARLKIVEKLRQCQNHPLPQVLPTTKNQFAIKAGNEAWYLLRFAVGNHFDAKGTSLNQVAMCISRLFVDMKKYAKKKYENELGHRTFFSPEDRKTFDHISFDCERNSAKALKNSLVNPRSKSRSLG